MRSAIKMAKSEMWARSDQKNLERLAHGVGPQSHSQGNLRAVFTAAPDLFHFDLMLIFVGERLDAITFYVNKANVASTPRPKTTKGEAKRLAVTISGDNRRKAGAPGAPVARPQLSCA